MGSRAALVSSSRFLVVRVSGEKQRPRWQVGIRAFPQVEVGVQELAQRNGAAAVAATSSHLPMWAGGVTSAKGVAEAVARKVRKAVGGAVGGAVGETTCDWGSGSREP